MEMILWAVGITAIFLFTMWMIIEGDNFLVEESRQPWNEDNNDSKK